MRQVLGDTHADVVALRSCSSPRDRGAAWADHADIRAGAARSGRRSRRRGPRRTFPTTSTTERLRPCSVGSSRRSGRAPCAGWRARKETSRSAPPPECPARCGALTAPRCSPSASRRWKPSSSLARDALRLRETSPIPIQKPLHDGGRSPSPHRPHVRPASPCSTTTALHPRRAARKRRAVTSSVTPDDLILVSVDDHICEPAGMFGAHVPERTRACAAWSTKPTDRNSGTTATFAAGTSGRHDRGQVARVLQRRSVALSTCVPVATTCTKH
jgi:hypothetical protein